MVLTGVRELSLSWAEGMSCGAGEAKSGKTMVPGAIALLPAVEGAGFGV